MAAVSLFAGTAVIAELSSIVGPMPLAQFDDEGSLVRPEDYRSWTHIGSWAVAKKEGEAVAQIHTVYAKQDVVDHFRSTGEWSDGTVLVKEVRNASSGKMT